MTRSAFTRAQTRLRAGSGKGILLVSGLFSHLMAYAAKRTRRLMFGCMLDSRLENMRSHFGTGASFNFVGKSMREFSVVAVRVAQDLTVRYAYLRFKPATCFARGRR